MASDSAVLQTPLVFVGGIHGVGKTTLSRRLAALLDAEHVTAGTLIRAAASVTDIVTTGVGNKAVPDVDANQVRLLQGLALHRVRNHSAGYESRALLLDGHFCLRNPVGEVVEIPHAVFERLAPVHVLLVEADVPTVSRRLTERDGEAPSVDALAGLAARERAHATATCTRLGIPLSLVRGDADVEDAAQHAASHLRRYLTPEVR